MPIRKTLLTLALPVAAAVASIAVVNAHAADWPTRPVRFIVPYTAGGGTDIVARMIGARLSELHKQPFLIESPPTATRCCSNPRASRSRPRS
jgi:tripartite-type tricarboxylate transporter receptor subunit TctC